MVNVLKKNQTNNTNFKSDMEHIRRKRRSNKEIEDTIIEVATQSIIEKGFNGITATGIMQKASIEPVQFYRRYNDLNGFIDEYVKRFDYWFSDVAKSYSNINDDKEQYKKIICGLLDSLLDNKIMQQLLVWELTEHNPTSRRTAQLRELHTLPLCSKYSKIFEESDIDVVAISAFLIGGIYYLVLHKDLSTFSGIDLNKKGDKERLYKAINQLSEILFSSIYPSKETVEIARKMKADNISTDKIMEYTNLSEELINSL